MRFMYICNVKTIITHIYMDLRIKEIAKSKGMTYKDIAERFTPAVTEQNVKQTLLNVSKGKGISTTTLEQFASALDVDVWELFISRSDISAGQNTLICPKCGARLKLVEDIQD